MHLNNEQIKELLIQGNYVSPEDIKKAEKFAYTYHTPLYKYLVSENILTKDLLGQAVAEAYKIPYTDLNSHQPSREQVLKIPESIAKALRVVLFSENKDGVTVTTDYPTQSRLIPELQKVFPSQRITITYSLPEDIDDSFKNYQQSLTMRFSKIIEGKQRIAPELLEEIFEDVFTYRASDVHFEPLTDSVVVRFRIDGVLYEVGRIPKKHYENVLNRIKVQSQLRIDKHFSAQDGSMQYQKGDRSFDIRTSIVPTIEGEKVVLRVLAAYIQDLTLYNLGLSTKDQEMLEEIIRKPFGMILVTGPTGSGKTTTLYSFLKLLNRSTLNITTIEDPVEYRTIGINQIQVNTETGLTFAKGLRSIVRQDPDVILVGEIRDKETAEIAVNAALTGHLLFSTLHANDASTAIPRLIDMGIEQFLLSSTLEAIVAQRLVRRICENCRYSTSVPQEAFSGRLKGMSTHFSEKNLTLYQGKGCQTCGHTGYQGRIAIFEIIRVTKEMRELILQNPSSQKVWELARKQGAHSLFEDGVEKVKNGIITLDELLRVAAAPE